MEHADISLDVEAVSALGFRLTWPGAESAAAPDLPTLHGWPVALSVPSAASGTSWAPTVKLTGKPLA